MKLFLTVYKEKEYLYFIFLQREKEPELLFENKSSAISLISLLRCQNYWYLEYEN